MLKAACKRESLDIASAKLWLAQGGPIADVLTTLEARHRFEFSSADCRAYATEFSELHNSKYTPRNRT